MASLFHLPWRRPEVCTLESHPLADERDEPVSDTATHIPQNAVAHAAYLLFDILERSAPAFFAACLRPKGICFRRIPGGNVNAIGHVAHRHFWFRPTKKQIPKQVAAYGSMQPAYAIHRSAAAHREIRHIERLCCVAGVPAAERQQLIH